METLMLRPDAGSYSQQEGAEVIGVALDGGGGRYRRDKIGAARTVSVAWTMNPLQYRYWRAFWNTSTKRGSLPFICDLVGETGEGPEPHTCRFIPGSVSMPSQMGLTYIQQATLEVIPHPVDAEFDAGVILLFNAGVSEDIMPALAHLVNVAIPDAL